MNYYNKNLDRWFVIGIAGKGDSSVDCRSSNKPGVFTRVRGQLHYVCSHMGAFAPTECQQKMMTSTMMPELIATTQETKTPASKRK